MGHEYVRNVLGMCHVRVSGCVRKLLGLSQKCVRCCSKPGVKELPCIKLCSME